MSRSSNTLRSTDVLTTPIKLKYSTSYDSASYYDAGIRVLGGVNGYVSSTGSIPQTTLNYLSVRNLFYSNYLTGSFPVSSSLNYNWEQSTAAKGTGDADQRYFPTGSGDKIKIISIPRGIFGEKISRKGFQLVSQDYYTYNIVDDGNGNLVDLASGDLYVNTSYFTPNESFTTGYVSGPERYTLVGNIIYSLGIIIITNPDYYNILDTGPTVYDHSYTYFRTDNPKQFDPLNDPRAADIDSSPLNTGSLQLTPVNGQTVPGFTVTGSTVVFTPSDVLYTSIGTYSINYTVRSEIGVISNTGTITVTFIPNCAFTALAVPYYYLASPTVVYDFVNNAAYTNSVTSSVVRDLSGNSNNGVFSVSTGSGVASPVTTYAVAAPSYLTTTNTQAVKLPDTFKFTGTQAFSFVTWVNIQNQIQPNTYPGIVAAKGLSGATTIGWEFYFNGTAGIGARRYNSAGASDTVTLNWSVFGMPAVPLGTWLYLYITYDGSTMKVGAATKTSRLFSNTVASTKVVTSSAGWGCYMGLNYLQRLEARYNYLAGYNIALSDSQLRIIHTATQGRF